MVLWCDETLFGIGYSELAFEIATEKNLLGPKLHLDSTSFVLYGRYDDKECAEGIVLLDHYSVLWFITLLKPTLGSAETLPNQLGKQVYNPTLKWMAEFMNPVAIVTLIINNQK
jgi:hypothetical protein